MKWENTKRAQPEVDTPVLIVANGVVQHVTYCKKREGDQVWFEPYFFQEEVKDDYSIKADKVTSWAALPEAPVC